MQKNPLDEIDGVGPGRKRALLHAFGSARGVSRASVADLAKVEGVSEALAQKSMTFSEEPDVRRRARRRRKKQRSPEGPKRR